MGRLLAPLAFVSPRIIAAIVDGTAPVDLMVTGLARRLLRSVDECKVYGRVRYDPEGITQRNAEIIAI